MSAKSVHKCANSVHQVCIFTNPWISPENPRVGLQT
jgi:hypothetical protein